MPSLNLGALLLPLIGGFLFTQLHPRIHFRLKKADGYRLFLESAAFGAGLVFVSRLLIWSVHEFCEQTREPSILGPCRLHQDFAEAFHELAPFGFSGTFVGAFLLGPIFGVTAFYAKRFQSTSSYSILEETAARTDGFLHLLLEAREERSPILVTFRDRIAYVGYVLTTEQLSPEMPFFRLLPSMEIGWSNREESFRVLRVYEDSLLLLDKLTSGRATDDDRSELARLELVRLEMVLRTEEVLSAKFFSEEDDPGFDSEDESPGRDDPEAPGNECFDESPGRLSEDGLDESERRARALAKIAVWIYRRLRSFRDL